MEKDNNSTLQQIDYTLLFIIFLLLCVSVISIYSVTNPDANGLAPRQFVWYIAGGVVIIVMMLIDFDRFRQIAWGLYGLGILLLIPLALAALPPHLIPSCETCFVIAKGGATSWYDIPVLNSFQPSEFMKIFLIITLSHLIIRHHETHGHKTIEADLWLLGKIVIVSLFPIGLVAIQPDFGTAAILAAIMLSLLLMSGIRWRILLATVLAGILFIAILTLLYMKFPDFPIFKELFSHIESRINGWIFLEKNPVGEGYQLQQSLSAIGSGQLYGKGFGDGAVYIPVAYSDFIFSVIAEQFGFLGASVVISLFFLLIYRMVHIALDTHDHFGSYLCTGVIGMLTFQVFQNIGMSVRLLPITGIPLPFLSYGGTALLTYMVAVGLVLNVRSRKRTYMFD